MTLEKLFVCLDMKELFLSEKDKVEPLELVDFAHQIMLTLNKTTVWQTCHVNFYMQLQTFAVEVSPALKVTESPKEFRAILKDLLHGSDLIQEDANGKIHKLMAIREKLPPMPKTRFALAPFAQRVKDPAEIVNENVMLWMSRNDGGGLEEVCFSKYPLSPLNQMMNIVSAYEKLHNLE